MYSQWHCCMIAILPKNFSFPTFFTSHCFSDRIIFRSITQKSSHLIKPVMPMTPPHCCILAFLPQKSSFLACFTSHCFSKHIILLPNKFYTSQENDILWKKVTCIVLNHKRWYLISAPLISTNQLSQNSSNYYNN